MANSYSDYPSDGTTRVFNIEFGYLARTHVHVYVDGEEVPYTYVTNYTVSLNEAPANGANVRVRRITPAEPLVDFQDGQNLTEASLDTVNLQSLYLAQESADNLDAVLQTGNDGLFSAQDSRIVMLAEPINPTDAVTKQYADQLKDDALSSIQSAREAAENSITPMVAEVDEDATAAANAAASAATSEANVSDYRDEALSFRNQAEDFRDDAQDAAAAFDTSNLVNLTEDQTISGNKVFDGGKIVTAYNSVSTSGTVIPDISKTNRLSMTLDQSLTIGSPTGATPGQQLLIVINSGTGGHLVSWGGNWVFPDGEAPELTPDANRTDLIVCEVIATDTIAANAVLNVS